MPREQKITFSEMRDFRVSRVIVFCGDYQSACLPIVGRILSGCRTLNRSSSARVRQARHRSSAA